MALPIVNALILMDGGLGKSSFGPAAYFDSPSDVSFGLFEFCRVLERTKWVGFDLQITRALRRAESPGDPETAAFNAGAIGQVLFNFRFNPQSFSKDQFDILFLFGVQGTMFLLDDPVNELGDDEAAVIARFMDAGGGVFATGDHEDLGWHLCHKIPRVGTMRYWAFDYANPLQGDNKTLKGAPPGQPNAAIVEPYMSLRHDTLQSGEDGVFQFDDQSDDVAQPIIPTIFPPNLQERFAFGKYPHPLLCTPLGMVQVLPDHAHEGGCVENPDLTQTINLDTYTAPEYPNDPLTGNLMSPVVVARGQVIAGHTTADADDDYGMEKPPTQGAIFPVISAFDGGKKVGRVVVESTWHHFFNINLLGDPLNQQFQRPQNTNIDKQHGFYAAKYLDPSKSPPGVQLDPFDPNAFSLHPQYLQIQGYYRNLIYWLIPFDRQTTFFNAAAYIAANFGPFSEEAPWSNKYSPIKAGTPADLMNFTWVGQLAQKYFQNTYGMCFTPGFLVHYARASGAPIAWRIVDLINPWRPPPHDRDLPPPHHGPWPPNPLEKLTLKRLGTRQMLQTALVGSVVCLAAHESRRYSSLDEPARSNLLVESIPELFQTVASLFELWLDDVTEQTRSFKKDLSGAMRRD